MSAEFVSEWTLLTDIQKNLLLDARQILIDNPYYILQMGGFAADVHPVFIGFTFNQEYERAMPIYRTDNGTFAIWNKPGTHELSSLSVKYEDSIYDSDWAHWLTLQYWNWIARYKIGFL